MTSQKEFRRSVRSFFVTPACDFTAAIPYRPDGYPFQRYLAPGHRRAGIGVDVFAAASTSKATHKRCPNLFRNQVLPHFGGKTALEHLCWDGKSPSCKKGCELVMDSFRLLEARSPVQATKSLKFLQMLFDHAIDRGGWSATKTSSLAAGERKAITSPLSIQPCCGATPTFLMLVGDRGRSGPYKLL